MPSSSNVLKAGRFELQGDFTQKIGNTTTSNFVASKDFTTILSGDKQQYIKFYNYKTSKFGTLVIEKSKSLVIFDSQYVANSVEYALVNYSVLTADTVKVIPVYEGGEEPYNVACYLKRRSNTKRNTLKAANPTFTPTAAASYDVKVLAKDADGSESVKTFKVTAL